jgi:hypothetical protein
MRFALCPLRFAQCPLRHVLNDIEIVEIFLLQYGFIFCIMFPKSFLSQTGKSLLKFSTACE